MAGTIYFDKRANRYYYEYKAKKIKKSLRTADLEEAKARARDVYGWLDAADKEKQIEELVQKFDAAKSKTHDARKVKQPLSTIYTDLLDSLKLTAKKGKHHADTKGRDIKFSDATLKVSRVALNKFTKWIAENEPSVEYMHEVTPGLAQRYMEYMRGDVSAYSYNRYASVLKTTWQRMRIKADLTANPFELFDTLDKETTQEKANTRQPFSLDELKLIQENAGGWMRPAVYLGYHTALRLVDICLLKWSEIDLETGVIEHEDRKTGKGGLTYAPEAMPELLRWKESGALWRNTWTGQDEAEISDEYVFCRLAACYLGTDRKKDTSRASKEFMRFLRRLDIDVNRGHKKAVLSFHSLRKSNATYSRASGQSVEQIKERLKHSSEDTTQEHYITESREQRIAQLAANHISLPMPGESASMENMERKQAADLMYSLPIESVREILKDYSLKK